MNTIVSLDMDYQDSESYIDQLIREYDDTFVPVPDIEFQPHLLISKVRKHYMNHIIRLLSENYESKQKLLNKNIYLPSAIWRCAKNIELSAAQTCMVVHLYRRNILAVIKQLKSDTCKGNLHKDLYKYLHKPPENDKKVQTSISDDSCPQCYNPRKKARKELGLPIPQSEHVTSQHMMTEDSEMHKVEYNIPVVLNSYIPQAIETTSINHSELNTTMPNVNVATNTSSNAPVRMSCELQESDDLVLQLEKLFEGGCNDDDIFDVGLCDAIVNIQESTTKNGDLENAQTLIQKQDMLIESHAAQIKSLDERVASLTGLLNNENVPPPKPETPKRRHVSNKWLCEEYYHKLHLFELLDQIRDCNRKKFARIKAMLTELFGDDSDDEDIMSPLEETPEFVTSCKERIAPWVVKLLTPYYIKGRIKGKSLFKALAKHLIRLIYQCSHYPKEYEVQSFIVDFLRNHRMIRCEADFKTFTIENLGSY